MTSVCTAMFAKIAICLAFGGLATVSATTTEAATATTAYDWGSYASNGAGNACRHTASSNEQPRTEAYMAVTHVPTVQTCRQFCDELQPCYGFEWNSDAGQEDKKGNCEIWVKEINVFKSTNAKFFCYNRTATYSSPLTTTDKVMAGFDVLGLNLVAIGANQTLVAEIIATVKTMVSAELVNATMGDPAADFFNTAKIAAGRLHIRLEFTGDSGYHAAELHNQIRALGRGKKLSSNWGDDNLVTPSSILTTQITNYLATLPAAYKSGTPSIVWDFTTLSKLAPAMSSAPTPAPTPAPAPTPGGTSIKQTTDSANFQSPALLLLGGIVVSMI